MRWRAIRHEIAAYGTYSQGRRLPPSGIIASSPLVREWALSYLPMVEKVK